jgi:hypothetical protein
LKELVRNKVKVGEICIGSPTAKHPNVVGIDPKEGRYFIEYRKEV